MKPYKKILAFANTDSKRQHGVRRAARLARVTGAKLKIVDVISAPRLFPQLAPPPWVTPREISRQKLEKLKKLAAPFLAQGVDVSIDVLSGTTFIELVREALRGSYDALFLTGDTGGAGRLFGSVSMHVLRKCPCPVGVVKPARLSRKPKILAAIDPTPGDAEHNEVNKKILDTALALGEWEGGEVHIIHAWHVFGEGFLRGHRGDSVGDLKEYIARGRMLIRDSCGEFLAGYNIDLNDKRCHFIKGEAAAVIPDFCAKNGVDIVVMGTIARRGVAGMFIGNTAEKIVSRLDCSLLAVKPDGFVSPIKPA